MIKNKSPLRYPGGKTRACKSLTQILESNFGSQVPKDRFRRGELLALSKGEMTDKEWEKLDQEEKIDITNIIVENNVSGIL